MAEGTDAPYKPNQWQGRPEPLPEVMIGSRGQKLYPNMPSERREPVTDMRPDRLLEAAGFSSAEEWGNSILQPKRVKFGDEGDIA